MMMVEVWPSAKQEYHVARRPTRSKNRVTFVPENSRGGQLGRLWLNRVVVKNEFAERRPVKLRVVPAHDWILRLIHKRRNSMSSGRMCVAHVRATTYRPRQCVERIS